MGPSQWMSSSLCNSWPSTFRGPCSASSSCGESSWRGQGPSPVLLPPAEGMGPSGGGLGGLSSPPLTAFPSRNALVSAYSSLMLSTTSTAAFLLRNWGARRGDPLSSGARGGRVKVALHPQTQLTSEVPAALLERASLSARELVLTACASSCSTAL